MSNTLDKNNVSPNILKLLVLQGIPGSGKSTWARNFIKNNSKKWVIISRDNIRDMLGNYWVPNREKLVDQMEYRLVTLSLYDNYNVIIDATNLNPKTINKWKNLVEWWKDNFDEGDVPELQIEFKEFKISLRKAIWRDWWRGARGDRSVGIKVVKQFYKKYYE